MGHKGWVDSFFYSVIAVSIAILIIFLTCLYFLHCPKKAVREVFFLNKEGGVVEASGPVSNTDTLPWRESSPLAFRVVVTPLREKS